MENVAATYRAQERYDEAKKTHKNALALRPEVLGKRILTL
jgi:hypothetical protein